MKIDTGRNGNTKYTVTLSNTYKTHCDTDVFLFPLEVKLHQIEICSEFH